MIALISHGSADARAQAGFEQLVSECQKAYPHCPTWGGVLELGQAPLDRQLQDAVHHYHARHLTIVPVFVGHGVHVREDIPAAVTSLQQSLPSQLSITISDPLGHSPTLVKVLGDRQVELSSAHPLTFDSWIVCAHGSRLNAMQTHIESVCQRLQSPTSDVCSAYVVQPPTLTDRIAERYRQGDRLIGVLPVFFFPGTATDSLTTLAAEIELHYPDLRLIVATALTPHPHWCKAIHALYSQAQYRTPQ